MDDLSDMVRAHQRIGRAQGYHDAAVRFDLLARLGDAGMPLTPETMRLWSAMMRQYASVAAWEGDGV